MVMVIKINQDYYLDLPYSSELTLQFGGNFHSYNAFTPFLEATVTLVRVPHIEIAEFEISLDKFGNTQVDLTEYISLEILQLLAISSVSINEISDCGSCMFTRVDVNGILHVQAEPLCLAVTCEFPFTYD